MLAATGKEVLALPLHGPANAVKHGSIETTPSRIRTVVQDSTPASPIKELAEAFCKESSSISRLTLILEAPANPTPEGIRPGSFKGSLTLRCLELRRTGALHEAAHYHIRFINIY